MITGKPGRLKTFDYLGFHRYFLTFCTYERRRLFVSSAHVELVQAQISKCASIEQFAIIAYCYMPDHVHLLIEAQAERSDLRRFLARAKQLSGFHFRQTFGQRLWQRYGFERTLRQDEETLSVARYIVENPVRAGIVDRVTDYPFSGSQLYRLDEILEAIQMVRLKPDTTHDP